jgi:acyl carrier protein
MKFVRGGWRWRAKEKERKVANEQGGSSMSGIVQRQEFPFLGPYVAPRTTTERKLADIWCRFLAMDHIGTSDDFEELGGDSLLAVSIFAEIEAVFGIAVPVGLLSRSPTIARLARSIDELVARRRE